MYPLYMLTALVQGGADVPVAVYRNAAVCEYARPDGAKCRKIDVARRYVEGTYFVVKPLGDGDLRDRMRVFRSAQDCEAVRTIADDCLAMVETR